jgi:hypothetical protein
LTDRFPRLLAIAVAIGSLTSFFGAWLSYYLDGRPADYRRRPDAAVFSRFCFRAEARPARQPSPRQGGLMLSALLEPFQFSFMVNAMLVAAIVAVPARCCRCFWCSKAGR